MKFVRTLLAYLIIVSSLSAGTITLPNLAALSSARPGDGDVVITLGGSAIGDNGARTYRYSASSAATVASPRVLAGPGGVGRYLLIGNDRIESVQSVSDLLAIVSPADGQLYQTREYVSGSGVGGNLYRYSATSSATINGGFFLPGAGGTLAFTGTTFSGTAGTGRFIAVDQAVADVTKFGAAPTTASANPIQRAISAALATSGIVQLGLGDYPIEASLLIDTTIAKKITIRGYGPTQSRLVRHTSFSGTYMLYANTDSTTTPTYARQLEGCTFEDFSVLNISSSNRVDVGIYFPTLTHSKVSRVWSSYAGKCGFVIGYNFSNTFDTLRSDNNTLHGFCFLTEVNNQNAITNCVSVGNGGFGWAFDGGKGISFHCVNAEQNAAGGIYFNRIRGVSITGGYFEVNASSGHQFTTFSGGTLQGGPWSVKADIIVCGVNADINTSTYAIPSDCSMAFPSQISVDAMSSYRTAGVNAVVFAGSNGSTINNTFSGLTGAGSLSPEFVFHGSHTLQLGTTIGRVDSTSSSIVEIEDVGRSGYSAVLHDIRIADMPYRAINIPVSGLTNVASDGGGTFASTSFKFRDGVYYSLGATATDGISTDYYGSTLYTYAYPEIIGKYATLVVEFIPGFGFSDTYGAAYNGNARLSFNGVTDVSFVASSAANEVATTGDVTSGTNSLVVSDASGIFIGDYVVINGAGPSGGNQVALVVGKSGSTLTLTSFADTTVSGAVVHTLEKRTITRTILIPENSVSVDFGIQRFLGDKDDKILIGSVKIVPFGAAYGASGGASGGGSLADGDKGDITVSGSGATWTVDNNVVTYAKMQDISATSRILGRVSAGAGDTEELTATQVRTLINVENGADVTDSTNVDAAGAVMNSDASTASMSFVIDEDSFTTNSATKVPTQQSVKAYVDSAVSTSSGHPIGMVVPADGATSITVTGYNYVQFQNSAATTVNAFATGNGPGHTIVITSTNGNTTINDSTNIACENNVDLVLGTNDHATFIWDGAVWWQCGTNVTH